MNENKTIGFQGLKLQSILRSIKSRMISFIIINMSELDIMRNGRGETSEIAVGAI